MTATVEKTTYEEKILICYQRETYDGDQNWCNSIKLLESDDKFVVEEFDDYTCRTTRHEVSKAEADELIALYKNKKPSKHISPNGPYNIETITVYC